MLGAANEQLKGGNIPVRIVTQGESERLYLRGTFPPKPGSGKSQSYQKRISLGIYFNPAGIKRAEAEAQRLNHLLMLGQFDWSDWLTVKQRGQMVGQWLKEFERDYFSRRERNPKSETTWAKDYAIPFNRLPVDAELTGSVLLAAAEGYPPDTRSRKRACTAYSALAGFAEVSANLKPLRGKYRPTAVSRDQVPSDALILEWCDRIPDQR